MVERVQELIPQRRLIQRYLLALLIAGGLLLLLGGLLTWPAFTTSTHAQEARTTEQAAITVTQTVGETPGICASTAAVAVPSGRTVYYCLKLRNSGDVPLFRHTLATANSSTSFTQTLNPGDEIQLTNNILGEFGATNRNFLVQQVSSAVVNTITVTSINATAGVTATGKAAARVLLGTVGIKVTKTVARNDDCSGSRAIAVTANTTVKYCVTIQNTGSLPLTNHHLTDPRLNIDVRFPFNIPVNASLRITDGALRRYDSTQHLELTITEDVTNSLTVTSSTAEGAITSASNQAVAIIGQSSTALTATLGLEDNCSTTTTLTALNTRTVYHCLRLTNNGTVPLETHTIQWLQGTATTPVVNTTITETVQPGQSLIITRSRLAQLAQANVATSASNNFTINSANRRGFTARAQAQNQLTVNVQSLKVVKWANVVSGSTCVANISLTVVSNQDFYYCIIVTNNGAVPLVRHTIVEGAPLNIDVSFDYALAPSRTMTLTNDFIANTLKLTPFLGPFRVTAPFNGSMTINSSSAANVVVASTPVVLQVAVTTPTPTLSPQPTPLPTFTPSITPTPTPSLTQPPTPTPSPVVVSFLPTPTQPFSINAVATPTPGLAPGALPPTVDPFATPTIDPFAPPTIDPFAQPTSPLVFPPPVDVNATFVAATLEAAATQTMVALLQPLPTDTPGAPLVDSPLATPPLTTTVVLTPTPVILVLTPLSTPPSSTGYLSVMAQVFQVSTATLGWLWFVVGSVIFFATAGMFAGLSWRSQRRRGLYEVNENATLTDEAMQLEADPAPPFAAQPLPTQPPTTRPSMEPPPDDDDYWPPSLR